MPILPNIGRKSFKLRVVIFGIYAVLIIGSVTMIYPFLLMLSGSVKGLADIERMDAVPQVLYNEQVQFARFEEDRYYPLSTLSATYGRELMKNSDAVIPKIDEREAATHEKFLKEKADKFPEHFYLIYGMKANFRIMPRNYRMFRDGLRKECGPVEEYNRRYGSTMRSWNEFPGVLDTPLIKEFNYEQNPLMDKFLGFKRSRPLNEKAILNIDGLYLISQKYFPQVRNGQLKPVPILTARCPKGPSRELWIEFVKTRLNCLFIRLDAEGLRVFQKYLAAKFPDGITEMNQVNDTAYPSFDAINPSSDDLRNGGLFTLYMSFITNDCPPEHLVVDTPSTRYREYVSSASAMPSFLSREYSVFREMRRPFMYEIITRNYRNVIDFMMVYGRAVFNTLIYIGLSILAALTVNPLAAYALSRFNLKSTYMILMFFLTTMAFPGAVTMIPNFLLLKHLHLLNTFWALLLPIAANGFSIFILKGFFDSIPREVYESALIDGAGEWTMFWRFTMALSKPILALITLGAFTAAYTAFMFALIICPDERMWTLMVWLFQLQQGAHQSVIYAALVLAAIPTLLVFVFAQNTIMKGIVIPVEK